MLTFHVLQIGWANWDGTFIEVGAYMMEKNIQEDDTSCILFW
jgi:hypothetical protein